MREWLRGGAPPCQGGGRGFESRLALFLMVAEALIYQGFRYFLVSIVLKTVEDSLQCFGYEVVSLLFGQWIVDITEGSI